MIVNMGTLDRAIRLVLGMGLIAAALLSGWAVFDSMALRYGAIIVGVVILATATSRFCPLYTLLGVKTCQA